MNCIENRLLSISDHSYTSHKKESTNNNNKPVLYLHDGRKIATLQE